MSKKRERISPASNRSRRRIIEFLKLHGAQDAATIAEETGTTAMAVRQHLYQMQDEKLVVFKEEPRPVGRPAKLWELTEEANRYFPDAHAALAVDLIGSLEQTFGSGGLEKLVAQRAEEQTADYLDRIPKRASLKTKLAKLAEFRTEEGYMAEVCDLENGEALLIENHCPICSAAASCTGLCSAELDVFRKVLGNKARVERTELILEGSRRCAYRISKA